MEQFILMDVQMKFETNRIKINTVGNNGESWKLQSTKLPGDIIPDRCKYSLGFTGKQIKITLEKANSADAWQKKFCFIGKNMNVYGVEKCADASPASSKTCVEKKADGKGQPQSLFDFC